MGIINRVNKLLYKKIDKIIDKNINFKPTHKVKLLTNSSSLSLREEPDSSLEAFIKIPDGTYVQYIATGSNVIMKDIKGYWYEIRTKDNIYGWCFSGSLEKI